MHVNMCMVCMVCVYLELACADAGSLLQLQTSSLQAPVLLLLLDPLEAPVVLDPLDTQEGGERRVSHSAQHRVSVCLCVCVCPTSMLLRYWVCRPGFGFATRCCVSGMEMKLW